MFLKYLTIRVPLVAFAPDAGGGAGGGDASGSAAASTAAGDSAAAAGTGDGGAAAAADAAGAGEVEESLDELLSGDDDALNNRPASEQLKALRDRNRKFRRRFERDKPMLERVKGVNLDETLQRAEAFQTLQQLVNSDPARAAAFLGLDVAKLRPSAATTTETRANPTPTVIDLAKLPFDKDGGPVNQFLYSLAETVNRLTSGLDQVRGTATSLNSKLGQDAARSRATTWKGAMDKAAEQISDEGVRVLFKDALILAFQQQEQAIRSGRQPKAVEFFVNHYLTKLKVSAADKQRVNDALRQRGAEQVANGGRRAASSTATAAPADAGVKKDMNWARNRMMAGA